MQYVTGGILLAGSVIKIDLERVCFAELIYSFLLRSVPVYVRRITRDACGTKLDVSSGWINEKVTGLGCIGIALA